MFLCITSDPWLVRGCVHLYFFIFHVIFSSILFLKTEQSGSKVLKCNDLVMSNNNSAHFMKMSTIEDLMLSE